VALRDAAVLPATAPNRLVRRPGAEPLPGYRLLELLGSGGFGVVWKCEAPGGLFKAVKFVGGDPNVGGGLAAQEHDAIERIKRIRHPFLLSLERVEILDGVLVLVMELADRNLQSVLFDYQGQGRPGVPREQLLRFLREAAEALDVINFEHGLQHLDVKPSNLFVVSNHIKVADFGLVHRLPGVETSAPGLRHGGATPLYASPETLQGSLSRHSDQYSLAIVYQQLLTGTVPFWSSNPYQLLLMHVSGAPDLSPLPPPDRPLVARALAKTPEQRFPSCMDFVRALIGVIDADGEVVRVVRPERRTPPPASVAATRVAPSVLQQNQATVPSAAAASLPPTGPENDALYLPQSSEITLPGYRFLSCVGRSPFGCLWTAQDADGRERLAHVLLNMGHVAADAATRLRNLHHPALADREVFWVPPGCLVIVTELGGRTLRDLFDECRGDGLPGVPRQPLLNCLAAVAETLDELNKQEKISHMGINPTQVLLDDDGARLEDFGLTPLLWLPAGRPPAQLNARYSAPELYEPIASPTADQYSLALLYVEMLTGIYPRSKPPGGKSGTHRRPGAPLPALPHLRGEGREGGGSGLHRRPNLSALRPAPSPFGKVDLDFLPVGDRPAVARALHDDPVQRFPNCTAFLQALQAATPPSVISEDRAAALPPVVAFARLMGKTPTQPTSLPPAEQAAADLIAAVVGPVAVHEADNARYIIRADGAWEQRFPIRLFASLLRPKLEGFRQQWNARPVDEGAETFAFEIRTNSGKGGFWSGFRPRPAGLIVRLSFQPADAPGQNQREAVVRVGLFGDHGSARAQLLPATAPRLFQSLRAYLQGGTDQRQRERWPFAQHVGVYPVIANLEIGRALEGWGCDISLGGVRLLAPEEPPSEFAYLHFNETPKTAPLAVLGRIIRVQRRDEGVY
jgi:serine/threonine protein kinase